MKLGLGLDVRKASAPAFKGLLDKFTGAVAAYSTRKLTASHPNILPADYGDGAAAAYSLRKVKASYSGNCIDVRRSSDHEIASIGFSGNELDTTALEDFVGQENRFKHSDPASGDYATLVNGSTAANDWGLSSPSFTNKTTLDRDLGNALAYPPFDFVETGETYTISAYVNLVDGNSATFGSSLGQQGYFNLRGTAAGSPSDYVVTNISGNIYRISATIVAGSSAGSGFLRWANANAGKIEITGFQIVKGSTLTDYVETNLDVSGFGYVTKWYDQSGNENDATQGTDNDQPQIVDAGSTILENGKPAIQFDGVDDGFGFTALALGDMFISSVQKIDGTTSGLYNGSSDYLRRRSSNYRSRIDIVTHDFLGGTFGQQTLISFERSGSSLEVYEDGTSLGTSTTSATFDIDEIGGGQVVFPFDGTIQELIFFNSDQSDNRQDIEWNINNHYNIYTDSWDKQSAMEVRRAIDNETTNIGFVGKDLDTTALETFATESSPVLDDYTGAAAAYSLRKVRSAYTGSAVRVRRSSDNELKDIGFDANGDLDTTALTTFVGSQNLADWSENFGNFDSPSNVTLTSGISDPFGGTDATELISSSDGWLFRDNLSHIQSGTQYTISIYARAKTEGVKNGFRFIIGNAASSNIETTTTWTRYTATITANGTACGIYRTSPNSFAEIEIYGFQINEGTSAQSYATTSGTYLSGDGAVTTWYDQSGNGNDATNSTESEQPLVVSGGTLVEENSKAALDFDGADDYFTGAAKTTMDNTAIFAVIKSDSNTQDAVFLQNTLDANNEVALGLGNKGTNNAIGSRLRVGGSTIDTAGDSTFTATDQTLVSYFADNTAGQMFVDGTEETDAVDSRSGGTDTSIGARGDGNNPFNGAIQEVIFFESDQSSNRTGIEGNIGRYYNIDGFRDVFVSKWYDQSGNFNHAENSADTQQPQIVDGGSVITEGTTPKAALDFDGVDDSLQIVSFDGEQFVIGNSFMASVSSYRGNSDDGFNTIWHIGGVEGAQTSLLVNGYNQISNKVHAAKYRGGYLFNPVQGSSINTQYLNTVEYDASFEFRSNGTLATDTSNPSADVTADTLSIGAGGSGNNHFLDGLIQEVVLYDSDQSANRTDIENNINKHFKIYE